MKLKIDWLVKKSPEWIVATLLQEDSTKLNEVSINKTSKKGEPFPNFDGLMPGHEIEGELWQSDKGKWYLFPSKAQKMSGGAYNPKQVAIKEAQDTKRQDIHQAQETRGQGVKVSATMRDSVQLAIVEWQERNKTGENTISLETLIKKWRTWLWNEFDKEDKDFPPF